MHHPQDAAYLPFARKDRLKSLSGCSRVLEGSINQPGPAADQLF
jgi:hypothetical protein